MTPILTISPISRELMLAHSQFIVGSRLAWLKLLGSPKSEMENRAYMQYFTDGEAQEFILDSNWNFKHFLAVNGMLPASYFAELLSNLEKEVTLENWHLWLIS